MSETVLRHYEQASAEHRAAGRVWYPTAYDLCAQIAGDAVPVDTVARVMAILSPRCFWQTCVGWTRQMVDAYLGGHEMPRIGTVANRSKAWRELHGESAISGPKATTFARAILGDTDAVVIDSWVLRTMGLSPNAKLTPNRQRWITAAYTEAAAIAGETPREMQAIVWCAIRGSAA